jgi:hypothetical protein
MKADSFLLLAAALVVGATSVSAQVAPGAPGTSETIPEKDRSRPQDMPKGPQINGLETGRSSSDALKENGGVIEPPKGIDPEIVTPPPETKSPMPVIPPPRTPGGPPGPEPK